MESSSTSSVPVQLRQGLDLIESITSVNSPINFIPPEILSQIFLACTICWTNDSDIDGCSTDDTDEDGYLIPTQRKSQGEFTSGSHLPWIEITRVCHYWRSVALACLELWSGLIFSSRKVTKQMIRLSKSATLVVRAGSSNWSSGIEICENARMAIAQLQRVSVLHLQFPADLLQPLVDGLVAAAPKLQSLRLSALELSFVSQPSFTLPETIFNQYTPSLRILALTHCKFVWESLPLHGITQLELRMPVAPPTIAQILSFLRESHSLDTVILDRAFSTDSKHARTALKLFLPSLRRLTLDDSVDHYTDLLEYLAYSAKALVSFNCEMPSSDGLDRVFHAMQSAAEYGEGEYVIHALSLSLRRTYYPDENRLTLTCWVIVRDSTPPQHSCQPAQLTFRLSTPFGNRHFLAALRAAGTGMHLTDVQTLYVGPSHHEVDWLVFLRLLPNVHTVHLELQIPIRFVEVLADNGRWNKQAKLNASTTLLLPRLRNLRLTGVSLRRRHEAFLTFLQSRRRFGVAIEHICLRDCWELSDNDVIKLERFVRDVDWDEIEQYYWDDEHADVGFYCD